MNRTTQQQTPFERLHALKTALETHSGAITDTLSARMDRWSDEDVAGALAYITMNRWYGQLRQRAWEVRRVLSLIGTTVIVMNTEQVRGIVLGIRIVPELNQHDAVASMSPLNTYQHQRRSFSGLYPQKKSKALWRLLIRIRTSRGTIGMNLANVSVPRTTCH